MSGTSSPKSRYVRGSAPAPWESPLVESLEPRLLLSHAVTFTATPIPISGTPLSVAAGDFTGNGKLDLVVTNNFCVRSRPSTTSIGTVRPA